MKPTFALNLSNESVGLLHRTPRGWLNIGEASFAEPDLNEALSYLRSTALGLSPRGITTKLVIPNAQILYLEVEASGPDAAARRRQIKAALKDQTSIPVEDLVFDWSGKGKTVQVAAVERVTLEEAEAFAVENRFNPVSFVAIPDAGRFKGEPWFGSTKVSASILAAGEKVERESEAIEIAPRDLPKPEPITEEPVVEMAPVLPAAEPDLLEGVGSGESIPVEIAPEPVVEAIAPVEQPSAPVESLVKAAEEQAAGAEPAAVVQAPVSVGPALAPAAPAVPTPDEDLAAARAASSFVAPKAPARPAASFPPPSPTPAPLTSFSAPAAAAPEPQPVAQAPRISPGLPLQDEAPMALDVPGEPAPPSVISDLPEDDLPPPPSPAAMAAFASRRSAAEPTVPRPLANPSIGKPPTLGGAGSKTPVERPAMAKPVPRMPAEGLAGRNDAAPRPVAAPPRPAARPESAKPETTERGLKGLGALVTATTIPGARKKKAEPVASAPAPIPATPVPQTAAPTPAVAAGGAKTVTKAASNSFGSKPMPQRGKPRYLGLILTGILLLFLALVAAWSKFYLASGSAAPDTTAVASATPAPATEAQPTEAELQALSDAEAEADGQDVAAPAEAVASAEPDAEPAEPAPDATISTANAAAVANAPAPDTVVGTEAATAANPAADNQDEIFLAAMDAPPTTVDPVALTAPAARGDPLPAAPLPPPPFGTVYQFDADGNILPTPDGIVTPEGVRLVAGPPSKVPPQRPAALEQAAAPVLPAATAPAVSDVTGIQTFEAIPELAGARPRARPAGLAPAQQGEADPSLALPSDSRFASLRPKERPAELTVPETQVAAANGSLVDPSASPLAVKVSLVPAPRPKDLSRAVEAAVAAAARLPDPVAEPEPAAAAQPTPEPEPAVAARPQKPTKPVEPEAEDEPEVASNSNAPQLQGTVAKKATFVNAINLGKINLIGVYGTPAKRYALIRLASGRYKKVKVGDTVEGGKIVAISTSEVKYQKGGQVQTLGMPRGTD